MPVVFRDPGGDTPAEDCNKHKLHVPALLRSSRQPCLAPAQVLLLPGAGGHGTEHGARGCPILDCIRLATHKERIPAAQACSMLPVTRQCAAQVCIHAHSVMWMWDTDHPIFPRLKQRYLVMRHGSHGQDFDHAGNVSR